MATRIGQHEILIGHPLRADVRDRDRVLLARAGWVVENERERNLLLSREGMWFEPAPALTPSSAGDRLPLAGASAARTYEFLNLRLDRICREIATLADFESHVLDVVKVIRDALGRQYDALLAQITLGSYPRYSIRHSVDTAILVEAMGMQAGHPAGTRNAAVSAALTMNLSMLDVQDRLRELLVELPESVLQTMREHPQRSVGMLKKAGVQNASWLAAVAQHHERLDGSGYPARLRDSAICLEAQMVRVADVLLARMEPSAYRDAETPAKAFWASYEMRGVQLRQDALTFAAKAMGLYPPGTMVRLANHELAVVTSRGSNIAKPLVKSIVGERNLPLSSPVERDTGVEGYAVVAVVDPKRVGVAINPSILWPA